jgi:dTDP-4-dehydrorhamnose reductase
MVAASSQGIDVWGGIECSVNRLGDRYHNQLELGGHAERLDDLERIASLGIRTVRYPVLWELAAKGGTGALDWHWHDQRLQRLRTFGIEPIAGLVHHGSGPRDTSLLDESFADGLEAFAGEVAVRYPWISRFTPVNEPLTTARFSALYGLWYPHARSDTALIRALLVQCRATVMAMRAIRRVRPDAKLVQTEDFGRVFSTPLLAYQAEFENERRWLTWDLLSGRVDRNHALWWYLRRFGARSRDLDWFRAHPCPPDIVGINHYVTSNRFLHEELALFPPSTHGGNRRHAYADIEAVRVLPEDAPAWDAVIEEVWQRYQCPLALTEVHLGCTRDEQMRWLYQAWNAAHLARERGCDIRAVTPWALFGSHDWASLLTRFDGVYEPGAWDVRAAQPRRTALADLIAAMATGAPLPAESWLKLPGWWQRETRLHRIPCGLRSVPAVDPAPAVTARIAVTVASRTVLITGATGTLGSAFARACTQRGLPFRLVSRSEMDISDAASVARTLDTASPLVVINTAGYVRVDDAEEQRERCERENLTGAAVLAAACADRGLPLLTFSSDLVFDGTASRPYTETDAPSPICVYGESKARAERSVLERHPRALVVRTSAFFGPWDEHNFLTISLSALARGETVAAADDVVISPTYVPDLTHVALDLLLDGESGLWHLANRGQTTWFDFAADAAARAGIPVTTLQRIPSARLGWRAPRPRYSVLHSARGNIMPTLATAVVRYVQDNEFLQQFRQAA